MQLAERIAATEAAIDAEAQAWLAGVGGGQQPLQYGRRRGGGRTTRTMPPGGGGAGGGGVPRRLAALAATLARLRAAQAKLAASGRLARGSPAARIAAAQEAVAGAERRLEQAEAAQAAEMDAVRLRGGCREGLGVRQEAGAGRTGTARMARIRKNLTDRAGPAGCGRGRPPPPRR